MLTGRRGIALAVLGVSGAVALHARSAPASGELGRPDAALTRLFTPAAAPPGACEVSVSDAAIEAAAAALRARPGADREAWQVTTAGLTDAFGTEGPYDRARLARLINGGRIRLARGSITSNGATVAYTLIAPVPDAAFESLRPGTMILRVDVQRMLAGHATPAPRR